MTRYSVRTELTDGTVRLAWAPDQRKAYVAFANRCRDAKQNVRLIQLRRHDAEGITIVNQREGVWQPT